MRLFLIAKNLLKRTIGTLRGFGVFVLIPSFILSMAVLLFGGDSQDTIHRVHVVNLDHGELGAALMEELEKKENYLIFPLEHPDRLKEMVATRQTNEAFIIPENFTEKVLSGQKAEIEMVLLNIEAKNAALRIMLDSLIDGMRETARHFRHNGPSDPESVASEIAKVLRYENVTTTKSPESLWKHTSNNGIAEVNRMMLVFIMGIISYAVIMIVHDRQHHLLSRIYTAPVSSTEIVLGNFLGSLIVGTIQIALILFITRYLFGYTYGEIPVFMQWAVLEMFLLASLGIAAIVGGLAKDSNYIGLVYILVILPTCMIGGCFWSIDDMPWFLQKLSYFVPQSWTLNAIQELDRGAGLLDILPNLSILALFAAVFLLFGGYIFRPNESE